MVNGQPQKSCFYAQAELARLAKLQVQGESK